MDPSPVTIRHPEGYALGILLPLSFLPVCTEPVHSLSIFEVLLFTVLGLTGLFGLYRAASREVLDETGISLKRPFGRKQYAWNQVQAVQLLPMTTNRGRVPILRITLPDRPLRLRCTGDSLDAIRRFYGEPDEDLWGNGIP